MENITVKIEMYSSHLADRNMRECKTVWLKGRGYGSSDGIGL